MTELAVTAPEADKAEADRGPALDTAPTTAVPLTVAEFEDTEPDATRLVVDRPPAAETVLRKVAASVTFSVPSIVALPFTRSSLPTLTTSASTYICEYVAFDVLSRRRDCAVV